MEQGSHSKEVLRSSFWDDEDMRELVEFFVSELATRIDDLESAWKQANAEQVRVFAHQLKGAAPGYGFDDIGMAAGALESELIALGSPDQLPGAEPQFKALVELCRRAAIGNDQETN